MGLSSLNARLQDPAAAMWVGGIFPKVPLSRCCLLLYVSPAACARLGPRILARIACCGGSSGGTCTPHCEAMQICEGAMMLEHPGRLAACTPCCHCECPKPWMPHAGHAAQHALLHQLLHVHWPGRPD